MALVQRYQKFVENLYNSDALIRKQHLAMYLLGRLTYVASQSSTDDFDMTTENSWPHGRNPVDEWGKNSVFLGSNVCKTTWLDVPCAKKVFQDGVREEEILLEARILACLNHPNIVKFICWGHETENAWHHFIAMEQMERGLHSLIRKQAQLSKGPPFPLLSAMDIMLQIAYGMCYLHDNGVAHRDLKTCNVVACQITTPHLQDYVHVKLIDFGLSKVKLSASRSNTISRPKIGTTVYMAPEAFQHGRANWFKVDVYSFGIMCSVILSGEEPFSSVKRSKIYEAICKGERPMLPTETPEDLACLIKDCWATDQNIRPNFLDICIRLAKLRHKLLRGDPHDHCFKNETDVFASLYIQNMIKKRSDAQKQDCKQLLKTVTEEDEWFDPDQEFGIQKEHEPKTTASYGNESSSYVEIPKQQLRNSTSGSFEDDRSKSDISWSLERAQTMPSSTQSRMQPGESKEPSSPGGSSPLRVQPGDLIGLKRQHVQLLKQNGGEMMFSKVPAEYNKLFGRPFNQAEYNRQRLGNLIDKMKDTLVIKGDGTSKTLHLIKKEQGRVTNKYKPSSNRASAPKGDKDKDTSEDSEPEDTVPPNKKHEKENNVEDRIPVSQFQDPYPEYNMPWTAEESDPRSDEDVYGEEILAWRSNNMYNVAPVDYGHQQYVMPGQVQPQGPRMSSGHRSYRSSHTAQPGQMGNQASGRFVDSRGRSGISAPESAHVISSAHSGMQAGEPEEPTSPGGSSPLWVQPGDLIGLKRQLVQLLNRNGGEMMFSKVPGEYNKLFGRPFNQAEYNGQRLGHLIDKMKDTLVIIGYGTSKTLHLIKKEQDRVTNKYTGRPGGAIPGYTLHKIH